MEKAERLLSWENEIDDYSYGMAAQFLENYYYDEKDEEWDDEYDDEWNEARKEERKEGHDEAHEVYGCCLENFEEKLPIWLCRIYCHSHQDSIYQSKVRDHSLYLLHEFLPEKLRDDKLSPNCIRDLKSNLVSCLRLQKFESVPHFYTLSEMVRLMCRRFLPYERWDELRDYIVAMTDSDFIKASDLYQNIPAVPCNDFLMNLSEAFYSGIVKYVDPNKYIWSTPAMIHRKAKLNGQFYVWTLAFKAGFTFGLNMAVTPRNDLAQKMLDELERSAIRMFDEEEERVLKTTLEELPKLMEDRREQFFPRQKKFVSTLMDKIDGIKGVGIDVVNVVNDISERIEGY